MRPIPLVAIAFVLFLGAHPALAGRDHRDARRLVEAGKILPLAVIVERLGDRLPGHLLDTKLERERGRYLYEFEFLDDRGVVWEMEVDATSGEVLKTKRDD